MKESIDDIAQQVYSLTAAVEQLPRITRLDLFAAAALTGYIARNETDDQHSMAQDALAMAHILNDLQVV